VVVVCLAVVCAALAGRGSATADRPLYARGDSWTYRTNLTETLNLSFSGNTTLEAGDVGDRFVQGEVVSTLELFLSGGGTFAGGFPGFGTVRGNWTIVGTDWWETQAWKPVRSFVRIVADGELRNGPTAIPVTFELVNETTKRIVSDDWPWPIDSGATGSLTARWNASENLTVQFQGSPPQSNETRLDAVLATDFSAVRTEAVTVPAGTFDTEVIREAGPEGGYRMRWYAAKVGNDVREEDFNGTGSMVATSELTAYRYAAGESIPSFPWLPALVAALGVVVVVLLGIVAVRVRLRRQPAEAWMPPDPDAPRPPSGSP
jgi:hypothetical protein